MRLVQMERAGERRVAFVDGDELRLIDQTFASVYALAVKAIEEHRSVKRIAETYASGERCNYETAHAGETEWCFLPAFDHPRNTAHCLVSGTGLTHKKSALNRAAMHTAKNAEVTDSYRMFQMGLEGGNPPDGQIGVQPEWFYKGDGSVLRGHLDSLRVPAYAEDGGEEPEIAGAYLISLSGEPYRVGFAVANEFSDHKMEKRNYLYLAPSKLRECAIGPELNVSDDPFANISGTVSVQRDGATIWSAEIWSGETNMSHSLANLEHHHFKYAAHCRPGDAHVHFFGADAFSFGVGVTLEDRDLMEVSFPQFGKPLRNYVAVERQPPTLKKVKVINAD